MPPAPPVHVVCAVIERAGTFLLAQRPEGKRLAGLWEFPGGKVEPGEEPHTALCREITEELGCHITDLRPGPPVHHDYEWGRICLQPFLCFLTPGTPLPHAHEHASLIWVAPGELLQFNLAPADIPVVEWLQSVLSQG